jgi:hypothetical protein
MSVLVWVFGRRHDEAVHALGGRRPKSAKARSRGKYGTRQCSECYGDRMLVAISIGGRGASTRRRALRYGGVDVTRRVRVPTCQMILAVLDHALHADNT